MKLTKRACETATYEGGGSQHVLWDDACPGFGLRLYPSGAKAFVIKFRSHGRQRLMTLGALAELSVDEARARAQQARLSIREGTDPLLERRKAKHRGMTFGEFCEEYLERHARPKKRSASEDERRIEKILKPAWGRLPLAEIRRPEVAGLHHKHGKRSGYEANRALSLVSRMFGLAEQWGYVPEGTPNPARGIKKFDELKRDRWVRPEEMPRLLEAIEGTENPWLRGFFLLALLTGARSSELRHARWQDVDLDRGILAIPVTKSGRPHAVPLSPEACALLGQLPREDGNPYLFPGRVKGKPLNAVARPWELIRQAAKLPDVRIHDLRRTVGSWLAMSGESLPRIGKILNHSNQSTTAVYARIADDVGRVPLANLGAQVAAAAGEHAEALGLGATQEPKKRSKQHKKQA